jgi:hypothetical protein
VDLIFYPTLVTATMNTKERAVLETVNTNLRNSEKGQAIAKEIIALPQTEPGRGCKAILKRIATEFDIQIRYTDEESTPKDGRHQRLLEVDLMPMVVFFGMGSDRQAADNMASKCALGYLRTQLHVADPVISDNDRNERL